MRCSECFPFEQFTVADFPGLFEDHVGWYIPQGVGTVVKVPLAWISSTGGVYKYAGCKILDPLNPPTVLAVYRGAQAGQGAVVSASEYTTSTATGASTGVQVLSINFTREQKDFSGRPYVLEADLLIPGSRSPADEISRILGLYGITADATTFTAASAADTAAGYAVDALYGTGKKARTGIGDHQRSAQRGARLALDHLGGRLGRSCRMWCKGELRGAIRYGSGSHRDHRVR
jgi:hypothetical protein